MHHGPWVSDIVPWSAESGYCTLACGEWRKRHCRGPGYVRGSGLWISSLADISVSGLSGEVVYELF